MARSGYDGYRGRTRAQSVVRAVVGVVVVLLVLVVVGLIFGQRYIVYTDDGIRLDVPFLRQEAAVSGDVGDVSVQIIQKPDPTPKPPVPDAPYVMRAVSMSLDELERDGVPAVEAAGANTVIVDMKGRDGMLGYVSTLPQAQSVSAREDRVSGLIENLHRADVRVVARVSCFRDDALGRQEAYALLTNSGYRWNYDDTGLYWINPGLPSVRQYVADVVGELARLGFDEILLEAWGYPAGGELGWIRRGESYDPARLYVAVDSFVELARQKTEGTAAVLSLSVDGAVLDGSDTNSGQTTQLLEQLDSCRVWLRGEDVQTLADLVSRTLLKPEQLVWPAQAYAEDGRHLYLVS